MFHETLTITVELAEWKNVKADGKFQFTEEVMSLDVQNVYGPEYIHICE